MLSSSIRSLAFWAFVAGAGALWVAPVSARAGDKIEFSTPNVFLGIPKVEAPQADESKSELRHSPIDDIIPDDAMVGGGDVVIVTRHDRKVSRASDSYDRNDTEQSDPYGQYDNLNLKKGSDAGNGATNSWQSWNSDKSRYEKRNNESMAGDDLRNQMRAANAEGKNGYEQDDRFTKSTSQFDQAVDRRPAFFRFGAATVAQAQQEQFMPSYEQMKLVNEAYGLTTPPKFPSSSTDDFLQNSGPAASSDGYNPKDLTRRDSTDESTAAMRLYRPVENRSGAQESSLYPSPDAANSYHNGVREQPAILTFPKRPGDIFK